MAKNLSSDAGHDKTKATALRRWTINSGYLASRAASAGEDGYDDLSESAIRYGTYARFLFAIVALIVNIALPMLLRLFDGSYQPKPTESVSKLSIPRAWTCAHAFFALAMFSTLFVTSEAGATFIVASVGLSWALMLWAPFAIIGNELAARQSFNDAVEGVIAENEPQALSGVQAGAIIGVHNVATSAPQIISAIASSGIFGLARLAGSRNGTGWVLRAGGCASLVAAYLTSKLDQ